MPIGDSAVHAFRRYARLCSATDKQSPFVVCARIRGCCRTEREALSLLAVHDTVRLLRAAGKSETADAIVYVYFSGHGRTPKKNEISYRVRRFADLRKMDERTVWRRLDEAKQLYYKLSSQ